MIIPKGHRVLVQMDKFDDKDEVYRNAKSVGLELVFDKQVRHQASVDEGTVVKVGPTAWQDLGGPWAESGDRVVFTRNAGKIVTDPADPDTPYVVLNDEDIICTVIKE